MPAVFQSSRKQIRLVPTNDGNREKRREGVTEREREKAIAGGGKYSGLPFRVWNLRGSEAKAGGGAVVERERGFLEAPQYGPVLSVVRQAKLPICTRSSPLLSCMFCGSLLLGQGCFIYGLGISAFFGNYTSLLYSRVLFVCVFVKIQHVNARTATKQSPIHYTLLTR